MRSLYPLGYPDWKSCLKGLFLTMQYEVKARFPFYYRKKFKSNKTRKGGGHYA